ncbi:glycoside hydrolase [Earliella scabrosa]|nr:glycoside hydrolase [Earliella scabrosa]
MFTPSFSRLFTLCSALASMGVTFASPLTRRGVIPEGPKFVVYSDLPVSQDVLPPLDQIQGFNVVNLAFLLSTGPFDQAKAWQDVDPARRKQLKQQYNEAGVSLVVSAFGATDLPTTNEFDPVQLANTMAQYVLETDMDGIDVDWEEITLVREQPGVGEQWLATFTRTLRSQLPKGQFILSHAPVGPWFQPNQPLCPGGCYLKVDETVGDLIDWYNIQFYNQSPSPGYETCETLLNSAGGSALFEIPNIDLNKLVIGKPGILQDVFLPEDGSLPNNGFIDPATLGTCIQEAVGKGWKAGVMAFQFPNANTAWIQTVKGASFN